MGTPKIPPAPPPAPVPPTISSQLALAMKPKVGPASAAGTLGGTFMTGDGNPGTGKKTLFGQ